MQGIYATSTFLNSTCFSLLNPFYCDSNMVLPSNNQTAKSTPASVLMGPMSLNEQQAFLLVNAIHHNKKNCKDHNIQKLATLLPHNTMSSSFVSCMYASQVLAPQLNCLLQNELEGNKAAVPNQLIDLLFPSMHINDNLLKHLEWMEPEGSGVRAPGIWAGERFHDAPTKFMEEVVGTWMNKVA